MSIDARFNCTAAMGTVGVEGMDDVMAVRWCDDNTKFHWGEVPWLETYAQVVQVHFL